MAGSPAESPRARRGILVAGLGAITVAAVGAGAFVLTRDTGADVIVDDDAVELATDSNTDSTSGFSFAAAADNARQAASVVFEMDVTTLDGPMTASASFDRDSGRMAMDIDMSEVVQEEEFFPLSDSLQFIIDEQGQTAYVSADLFGPFFGTTDADWISLTDDEFSTDEDLFGQLFTNPLGIADVFGSIEPIDLGDETIDGELLRHFQVTLDEAALAELDDTVFATDIADAGADTTYDVWVDESNQIRRMMFEAVEEGEVATVDFWITVSSEPIDIAIPSADDVIDMDALFASAFDDFELDAQDIEEQVEADFGEDFDVDFELEATED